MKHERKTVETNIQEGRNNAENTNSAQAPARDNAYSILVQHQSHIRHSTVSLNDECLSLHHCAAREFGSGLNAYRLICGTSDGEARSLDESSSELAIENGYIEAAGCLTEA